MDFTDAHYEKLRSAVANAARDMKHDGWWLSREEQPARDWKLRSRLVRELLAGILRIPAPIRSFYLDIKVRKSDDHEASHHDKRNQALHLISSSVFIVCYALAFKDLTLTMCLGLPALFVRQIGHAIFEPPCHDKEKLLLGFTTRSKTLVVGGYLLIPIVQALRAAAAPGWSLAAVTEAVAWQWFLMTLAVVLGHVAYLVWRHDFRNSMIWLTKLVTDPFTDIVAYTPRVPVRG